MIMRKDKKKQIIDTTIRLIQEKGSNPREITVREICKEAGIGIGEINYYFQSKENLIEQCVQQIIGTVIANFGEVISPYPVTSPVEKLKYAANATVSFLYSNENISRISMLTDLANSKPGDNTEQTVAAFLPLIENACREKGIKRDSKRISMTLIMVLQGVFLRTERIKADLNVDMRNPDERKKFVDSLIDQLFNC
jgi:AcrR family transcriptional regulator